jgi:hypothetical protein
MPCGKKRKRHKIATHKRKRDLEKTAIRRKTAKEAIDITDTLYE